MENANAPHPDVLVLTANIVAAHVRHNAVAANVLPNLIRTVYAALGSVGAPARSEPAVPTQNSVFPDYIICLEDGKKLKMLKRHLKLAYGLTPEAYRKKWGLPPNYPMVAPNQSNRRSSIAKEIGLRGKATKPATEGAPVRYYPEGAHGKKPKRGRPPQARSI